MDVDFYNINLVVSKDWYTLVLISVQSYEVKHTIELSEEI
jgi:hypothetical protein